MKASKRSVSWRTRLCLAGLVISTAVAMTRIVLTYPVSFQTVDESFHIGCAALFVSGSYPVRCVENPPLSRIAIGLPLAMVGVGPPPHRTGSTNDDGSLVLRTGGRYERNLTLARLGVLPFFVIASLVVWLWARRLFGEPAALAAVLLFQGLPLVLAHSGFATTDMTATAMLSLAFYAFVVWLDEPTAGRTAGLGCALGLAVLAKFSSILFFGAGAVTILAIRHLSSRRRGPSAPADEPAASARPASGARRRLGLAVLAGLIASLVIWGVYGFSFTPLTKPADRPHGVTRLLRIDRLSPGLARTFDRAVEMPVPGGDVIKGLLLLRAHNAQGHFTYFLGEVRRTGWWYFFPTMLVFKTPVAFLLLLLVGTAWLCFGKSELPFWRRAAPALAALAILVSVLPTRINIGLRHVLPTFAPLAIVAGYGAARLFGASRLIWRGLGVVLAFWFAAASVRAHPDYLSSFNELAGPHPERIEADSDLVWGQDIKRVMARARERGIQELWYRCVGCRYLGEAGLPPLPEFPPTLRRLAPYEPVSGWVAIDEWAVRAEGEELRPEGVRDRAFDWLEPYPFERIGSSFRLYQVPAGSQRQ